MPVVARKVADTSRCDSRWFQHVNYPNMAIEKILQGTVEYRLEQSSVRIPAGGFYVVAPGSNVRIVNDEKRVHRKIVLIVGGTALTGIAAALGLAHDCWSVRDEGDTTENGIRAIGELIRNGTDAETLSGETYRFLLNFAERHRENTPSPVAAALEYMQRHFREHISLSGVAAAQHCSLPTLRRRFLQACGMNPHQWLVKLRLEYAAEQLRQGNRSVKEIAADCGWGALANFSAAFRARFGISPSAMRDRHRATPDPR